MLAPARTPHRESARDRFRSGDTAVLRLESNNFKGAFGFDVDYYAYGIADLFPDLNSPESVCGANNWMDVECYATSHPTEYDRARRAVVLLFNGITRTNYFLRMVIVYTKT